MQNDSGLMPIITNVSTIISVGLAIAAILSPILVAILNNAHQIKMRKIELLHDETLRKIEGKQKLVEKHIEFVMQGKKQAFDEFIETAGACYNDISDKKLFTALYASAYKAASQCSCEESRRTIVDFVESSSEMYGKHDVNLFLSCLKHISEVFQYEISLEVTSDNT